MGVTVWIAQLIGDSIQKQVTTFVIQIDDQILENVHMRAMNYGCHVWNEILRTESGKNENMFLMKFKG